MKNLRRVTLKGVLQLLGLLTMGLIIFPAQWGGITQITVISGNSMNPIYSNGDIIVSLRLPVYTVGDVIVYHPNAMKCDRCNVIHRIVSGSREKGWVTKGDNNPNEDSWKPMNSEILGTSVLHFPVSPISRLLISKWFWVTFLASIVSLFLFYKLYKTLIPEKTKKGKHVAY